MAITLDGTNGINSSGVIVAPDGSASAPAITNDGDTNTGIFFPAADTIAFAEGGVECARFNSSGNLQTIGTISVGNATPSTSGAGITFPATQSASSDANTLDDYEEGTWTPVVGQATGKTYSNQTGVYTKIGNQVICWCSIQCTSAGSGGSWLSIQGLPFTSASTPSTGNECVIQATIPFYSGLNTAMLSLYGGWGYNGSVEVYLCGKKAASTGTSNDQLIEATYAGSSFKVVAVITYRTA
jgi:hypothetical protein